jgi:hypothetical protein
MLGNILLFLLVISIIGVAVAKIVSDNKKGVKCPGCPYSKAGGQNCSCPDFKE